MLGIQGEHHLIKSHQRLLATLKRQILPPVNSGTIDSQRLFSS